MSDRLSEIEGRLAGATPGVWKIWGMDVLADQDGTSDVDTAVPVATTHMLIDGKPRTFDAELIAHAPTDLAALVKFAKAVKRHVRGDTRATLAMAGIEMALNDLEGSWPPASTTA